ncbi:MAG: chromate efflux transporter [Planctomycetota bacterium]|jgi:chromate transporter|nr:chromate efflux transporter [Planctomycetota bacterium]HBO52477.1 chromate transporter [Planctomycetota bacterium]
MSRLGELALLCLKLGFLGFGGPAAHIAMLEDEVVKRRAWISPERFLDMLGATNLIPGPNSTEMVLHVGFIRAGFTGLLVAGTCFVLPAVAIVTALAALYASYGELPDVILFFKGIQATIPALIGLAVWRLGRTAFKSSLLAVIGLSVTAAVLLETDPIIALAAGGFFGLLAGGISRGSPPDKAAAVALGCGGGWLGVGGGTLAAAGAAGVVKATLAELGFVFLKIGSVLFGTGYVLVAYLERELVNDPRFGITIEQLLDAVAAGNVTPGPILSTAAFLGYLLHGVPGAAIASAGIFLPSFIFVVLLAKVLWRLRASQRMGDFLDAVNASSVGLMAAVTVTLAQNTLYPSAEAGLQWQSAALAVLATVLLVVLKWSPLWLIPCSSVAGWLLFQL